MKKKMLIFAIVIIVLFAGIYFVTALKDNQATESGDNSSGSSDQSVDALYQNNITPDELDKTLNEDEDAFVYYYQPDCSHCQVVSPILIPMVEEDFDIDMKEFNLQKYRNKWNTYDIEATPTLVYYQNGKEVDRIVGSGKSENEIESKYKDFLQKHNG